MNASQCFFINTFGILDSVDQRPIIIEPKKFAYRFHFANRYGETIYLRTRDVDIFFQQYADRFQQPFILVTGCDTQSVPDDIRNFEKILSHPNLLVWFAQNYLGRDNPRIRHLPLGLDYHTLYFTKIPHFWGPRATPKGQETQLLKIRKRIKPIFETQSTMALANFQFSTTGGPPLREKRRLPILKTLKTKSCIQWLPKQSRLAFWESCNDVAFIVSPMGLGVDTHRCYEILALGRIPIIWQSGLNELYKGLPVLIIQDANILSEQWLHERFMELTGKWDSYDWEKLELKYWTRQLLI